MANLVNLQNGSVEDVGQDQVQSLLESGKYDLPKEGSTKLLNPEGQLIDLPNQNVYEALNKYNYKFAPQAELTNLENKKEFGEGAVNTGKAFLAGAARASTFGLSDKAMVQSGAVDPNTLEQLQKQNPVSSGLGEAAGVLGSIVAAPEMSLVGNLGKAGQVVSELTPKVVNTAAKLFLNPETAPMAAKVVDLAGRASGKVLGSAVEGAGFGLGQAISESALGDYDLTAEKILPQVELGAMVGGGIGAALGITGAAIGKVFPKFITEADKVALESGDFGAAVKASDYFPEKEKNTIIEGLSKLKPNAKEIQSAAADLDNAPVLAGQISASGAVQKGQSALLEGPPTFSSIRQQLLAQEGFEKASGAVNKVLGEGSDLTRAELGDELKRTLTEKVEKQISPINALYDELKGSYEAIPLKEKSLSTIARNIRNLDEVVKLPSTTAAKIARSVADDLPLQKTVEDIKRFKSSLNNSLQATASSEERRMVGILADKLANLEENTIVDFAKDQMKTSKAKDKIMGLLDLREQANKEYSIFKDKIDKLGDVLGKRRVYGASDFLNFLEDITPEKLSDKLFAKNNSKFLEFFKKEFPQEMQVVADYQKGLIKEGSFKDGVLNSKQALKLINKIPEDTRKILFNEAELNKLNNVKTYLESFPPNFNPSNTSNADVYRTFFETPIRALTGNARDAAIAKFIQFATEQGSDELGVKISNLAKIERSAQKTTKDVLRGVNNIFKSKEVETSLIYEGSKMFPNKKENFDKLKEKVVNIYNNTEKTLNDVHSSTQDLYDHAPNITGSLINTSMRAVSFLYSKVPQEPNQAVFDLPYTVPESEKSNFEQYAYTVQNPTSVLDEISTGTLDSSSMEVMTKVYPSLYGYMKQEIIESLPKVKNKESLPESVKISLSMFLQQDLDSSMNSVNISKNQIAQSIITQENEMKKAGGKKDLGNLNLSDRMLTNVQATAQRNLS